MLDCKKIIVIVLSLSAHALYAESIEPIPVCVPGSSFVPCATTAFDFSAEALYLKPAHGDKLIHLDGINVSSISDWISTQSAEWNWGVKLQGSYHYNTGNDLTVNWYHFDQETTNMASLDISRADLMRISSRLHIIPANLLNIIFQFIPSAGLSIPTTFQINPKWDAVNIEFGQIINFGENKSFRLSGGVQSARLDHNIFITLAPDDNIISGFIQSVSANGLIKYHGIGPRIGVDFYSTSTNGFGLYATAAATVLFGNSDISRNVFVNDALIRTNSSTKYRVIPELEGKVGAQFVYPIHQSYLSFNTGYMLVNFISNSNLISSEGFKGTFSLNGFYLGAKWVSSV